MSSRFLTADFAKTIAIVGGGFSGSLVATHLLKTATQPLTIKLVERSRSIGQGIAYATEANCHLLNVSAGSMSAFPHDPGHLLRWLHHNADERTAFLPDAVNAITFIPRKLYGLYIQSILKEAEATAPSSVRLDRIHGEVVAIEPEGEGAIVSLSSGRAFAADQVVLALGNSPEAASSHQHSHQRNAWSADALTDLDPEATVLLIGTGLTMVDMVLSLHERQHRGKIYAVSRRGLAPQRHHATQPYPTFLTPQTAPKTICKLVKRVRAEIKAAIAQGDDWRSVIDSLRPITQQIWQQLPTAEQQRFLRHLAPHWDSHRHRIAQQVADVVDEMLAGQLTISAGRIQQYEVASDRVTVTIRPRRSQTQTVLQVDRIVHCTGATADYRRSCHPLIEQLRSQGLIRPNAIGLGLETTAEGALANANGKASTLLYTLGTPRKGDLWETIAVPELRQQAQILAQTLLRSISLRVRPIPATPAATQTHISSSTLLFRQLFDPETSSYTYLIADRNTKEAVLVDPVLEQVDRDLQVLNELGLTLRSCLETHLHADHITGAGKLRQQTGCEVIVPKNPTVTKADRTLGGGEVLNLGSIVVEAIATPGHTASHIAYLVNKTHLLTGDALLIHGCGRTDFQGGDPGTLYDTVTQRLFTLPDETLVYPGHDYKGRTVSTIGEEKHLNPRFVDRELAERYRGVPQNEYRSRHQFITIMNNLKLSYPKKMNAAVPANEYCGDFVLHDRLATNSTNEEKKQIELTVLANTEIYTDYYAMYI